MKPRDARVERVERMAGHEAKAEAIRMDRALSALAREDATGHFGAYDTFEGFDAEFGPELEVARWLAFQTQAAVAEEAPSSALIALRAGLSSREARAGRERRRAVAVLGGMAAMFIGAVMGVTFTNRQQHDSLQSALVRANHSLVALQSQVHDLQAALATGNPAQIRLVVQSVADASRVASANAQEQAQAIPDSPARDAALAAANKEIQNLQLLLATATAVANLPTTTTVPPATTTTVMPTTTTVPKTTTTLGPTTTTVPRSTTTTDLAGTTTTTSPGSTTTTTIVPDTTTTTPPPPPTKKGSSSH